MPITILHRMPILPSYDASIPLNTDRIQGSIPVQVRLMLPDVVIEVEDVPEYLRRGLASPDAPQNGTLYITTEQIYWFNEKAERGFAVDYPSIALYGIGRNDVTSFLHFQLNLQSYLTADGDETQMERDSDEALLELRLVPVDTEATEKMFEAVSECMLLHPDEDDEQGQEQEPMFEVPSVLEDDEQSNREMKRGRFDDAAH